MTPSDIARATADQICRECCEWDDDEKPQGKWIWDTDKAAALILSAAAKMVRESGAVDALDSAQLGCRLDQRILLQNRDKLAAQCDAALEKLRSITEHSGESQQ